MKAFITGITGQDGSYLSEFLLSLGYEVHGTIRRSSSFNTGRIDHIFDKLHLHYADLTDAGRISNLIREIKPDEIYHLAAQSHVRVSFDQPHHTAQVDALGTLNILEAIRGMDCKFYHAGSSEMFGASSPPQNETTPFRPRSPYACSKLFAHNLTINYRESYGMFACSGILFNHESPRRGETFVTRKITKAVANIKSGKQDVLYLGNLDAKRDWGYAGDYVKAMWQMLQHDEPKEYVISTGDSHTVREWCKVAFSTLDLDYRDYVKIDPRYYRPSEVDHLRGDSTKARKELGWQSNYTFKELVRMMVQADYRTCPSII